jgi:hypothetical protein
MQDKDVFDIWNDEKYMLHTSMKQVFAHEREVWLAKVGKNIGNEQNGKDQNLRPILIYKKLW